jgi:hypothetical protein
MYRFGYRMKTIFVCIEVIVVGPSLSCVAERLIRLLHLPELVRVRFRVPVRMEAQDLLTVGFSNVISGCVTGYLEDEIIILHRNTPPSWQLSKRRSTCSYRQGGPQEPIKSYSIEFL